MYRASSPNLVSATVPKPSCSHTRAGSPRPATTTSATESSPTSEPVRSCQDCHPHGWSEVLIERSPNLAPMCGRFSITGDLDFYAEYFGVEEVLTEPLERSWNVAPTDPVYVITEREGRRALGSMRWGLVPHWAKDARSIHINARSETVASTPTFRDSFASKRCLIPSDGFYEWEPAEQGRTPHWVYRADGHPMAFAGIWAARLDPDTEHWGRTCSIITTEAGGVVAPIHHRMPVALPPETWDDWLD